MENKKVENRRKWKIEGNASTKEAGEFDHSDINDMKLRKCKPMKKKQRPKCQGINCGTDKWSSNKEKSKIVIEKDKYTDKRSFNKE